MQAIRTARALLILGLPLSALLAVSPPNAPIGTAPPPAEPSASAPPADAGIARAQQHIAEREYHASANTQGLQAPNRAQNLRSYFDGSGVRVHDRTAAGAPQLVALSLAAIGRGETLADVTPGEVAHDGARVEIRRPGLVEWYVNTEAGLEQGFTLEKRSEGAGPLVLELAIEGATARAQGEDVVFATGAGRKLSFAKLAAQDATGRALAAHFEVASPQRLRYAVDDAGAAYPVTIDPLLTGTADTRLESDHSSAFLGLSVEGAGDVNGDGYADVIVGAPGYDDGLVDEGSAFVFHGGPNGVPDGNPSNAPTQLLGGQARAFFGQSVAGAGDVNGDGYADVIVGAYVYDSGEPDEGAAFIFHGNSFGVLPASSYVAATRLESNQAQAGFGIDVASAGDVNGDGYADVIVGAPVYDDSLVDEGSAFVFHGGPNGVPDGNPSNAPTYLLGGQAGAFFGQSVAGAGDVNGDGYADVIVGADLYDSGEPDEGAAFIFHGNSFGVLPASSYVAATRLESNQAQAGFGIDVASAGDANGDGFADVIVGAHSYDAGETDEGAAFVFHGTFAGVAGGDPGSAATQLESNQASASLGRRVAGAGDVNGDGYADVIVGAPRYDSGEVDEGVVFVFQGSALGVSGGNPLTAFVEIEGNQSSATLGYGVAAAGDVNGDGYADVIVGALGYDAGQTDEGAAFVYHGGAEGVRDGAVSTAATRFQPALGTPWLGWSVAGAGDVNGDGYGDVIVGAPRYDGGVPEQGAAFVLYGDVGGVPDYYTTATAPTRLLGDQALAHFGSAVAAAGDVNGDGYADVIVGAPNYDDSLVDEGSAFVFHGGPIGVPDGNPSNAPTHLLGGQAGAFFGRSVAGAGDVNGDGYADVIVGALGYDSGEPDEGAAFIFHGNSFGILTGPAFVAATRLESNQAGALLGWDVASAGDVNGDGFADVIVSAYQYGTGGAAFVFRGNSFGVADGNPSTASTRLEGTVSTGGFGIAVAGAGDVNGDGYADVAVMQRSVALYKGAAYVFQGGAAGVAHGNPSTAATRLETTNTGWDVAGAGDVNGDGYADLIVGAERYVPPYTYGAARIFHGGPVGIPDATEDSAQTLVVDNDASFGMAVAGAGDVNADGNADVIVGGFEMGYADGAGEAFIFHGNGDGDGRPASARLVRPSDGRTLSPWMRAEQTLRVQINATHPAGRGSAKLQIQYCPPGESFWSLQCPIITQPSWTPVPDGVGGVALEHSFTGLTANTLHRWRARVLYAPETGTPPLSPAHGPWRRYQGQAFEADFRTASAVPPSGGCGIGPELALLVPALAALRRLRRPGR